MKDQLKLQELRLLQDRYDQLQHENSQLKTANTIVSGLMERSDWEAHRERQRVDELTEQIAAMKREMRQKKKPKKKRSR